MKRRPKRCGCGLAATHRVVLRTWWYDGLKQRTSSNHCGGCAEQMIRDAATREVTHAITGLSLRMYRTRGQR